MSSCDTMTVEHYEELTDRQKAFVDTVARCSISDEEHTMAGILATMSRETEYDTYVKNYAYNLRSELDHIIRSRYQELANERSGGGTVRVENVSGSYEGPAEGIDATMTPISDAREGMGGDDEVVVLELSQEDLFKLIRTCDEDVAETVFRQVMEDA